MKYEIKVVNHANQINHPLIALDKRVFATHEAACEAICDALLKRVGKFGCEMVDNVESADLGTLYTCDNNGLNAVPLNPDEEPYSREDVLSRMACFRDGTELREAMSNDGCVADVDFVSVNEDNEVVGYYQFVEADYADVCRAIIKRKGCATDDGVTATVEEVSK